MQKTVTTLLLLFNMFIYVLSAQTGPPGQCTKGQGDDRTHPDSEYKPVLYSFPASAPKQTSSAAKLQVMSFNIQSNYNYECQNALSQQSSLMSQYKPDFVSLQETDINVDIRCNCHQPQLVANALGYTSYFMQMFPYRTGKYGLITNFGYKKTDELYLYYKVASSLEQRGAHAFLVSPPQLNGQQMWYINTHLEQSSSEARLAQVRQLVDWVKNTLLVKQPNAVVVAAGDFYTVPGDGTYEEMAQSFTNAWTAFTGSSGGGYTHPSTTPSLRFDHIWYRDPASKSVKTTITNFRVISTLLSDHRPIIAEFSFSTSPSQTTTGSTTTKSTTTTGQPTTTPTTTPTTAPTTTPSPYACKDSERGYYRCVSEQGFQQCDHMMWSSTHNCPANTQCIPSDNYIYCGFPMK